MILQDASWAASFHDLIPARFAIDTSMAKRSAHERRRHSGLPQRLRTSPFEGVAVSFILVFVITPAAVVLLGYVAVRLQEREADRVQQDWEKVDPRA